MGYQYHRKQVSCYIYTVYVAQDANNVAAVVSGEAGVRRETGDGRCRYVTLLRCLWRNKR